LIQFDFPESPDEARSQQVNTPDEALTHAVAPPEADSRWSSRHRTEQKLRNSLKERRLTLAVAHSNGRWTERKPENLRRARRKRFKRRSRTEKVVPRQLPSDIAVLQL
jgi:hypothetical protein